MTVSWAHLAGWCFPQQKSPPGMAELVVAASGFVAKKKRLHCAKGRRQRPVDPGCLLYVGDYETNQLYMGVSKNRGTPKWMVYNGKPY